MEDVKDPFDVGEVELEERPIMYLVVEKDQPTRFPIIRGVFTQDEYEQALANAAPQNLGLIAVYANQLIGEGELSYVEDSISED